MYRELSPIAHPDAWERVRGRESMEIVIEAIMMATQAADLHAQQQVDEVQQLALEAETKLVAR